MGLIDRRQPMFPQNNSVNKGPQRAQARSPYVQPSSDFIPNNSINVSSIYENPAMTRRSKHERHQSQQVLKVLLPKEEVRIGDKTAGLDQLRDKLEEELMYTGPLDFETKAKVDILEHEKARLDRQIEKLK